jgi:hypothetical protein
MRLRLKQVLALWFALQIVLPFTAPLQTCDLRDLLGVRDRHSFPTAPESSTMPTTAETEAHLDSFVSPVNASALHASTALVVADDHLLGGLLTSAYDLSPAPQVQRAVLRL